MAKAAQPSSIDWISLADAYRHVHGLGYTPEDAKTKILDDMMAGRLEHIVERTIIYLSRPAGADLLNPPPIEVHENKPVAIEALSVSISGRGSLQINWQTSNAVRKAGTKDVFHPDTGPWPHIEFEGIKLSREYLFTLYKVEATGVLAATEAPDEVTAAGEIPEWTEPAVTAPPVSIPEDELTAAIKICWKEGTRPKCHGGGATWKEFTNSVRDKGGWREIVESSERKREPERGFSTRNIQLRLNLLLRAQKLPL
jgi:hypothetical protein